MRKAVLALAIALMALTAVSSPSEARKRTEYIRQVLPHPPGCPRVKFCGCGAALKVFGALRRDLWKASSWLRFPKAHAAPGMVAANNRHVMVIEQVLSGNKAVVYSANSGGGKTLRYVRSLNGFSIRNPRGR